MAPKKNAFFVFMSSYNDQAVKNGNKFQSYAELAPKLTPIWNSMTKEEKEVYQILADKRNKKRPAQSEHMIKLRNNTCSYRKMIIAASELFESIPDEKELLNRNFILLHVNCHAHNGEKYYFPAEIGALQFNLAKGVSRTYHQIIGISKIYPRGYAGAMREYSDTFHSISCFNDHPDDYKEILSGFLGFLRGKSITDRTDEDGDVSNLPIMYTIETQVGLDIIKTKDSLERLYKTVFPNHKSENGQDIFKLGTVETLLYEMKKKMNLLNDQRNILPGMAPHDVLESDIYGLGLGCVYHELRDIAFKCSKARVLQWMSNICQHINMLNGLHLVPGKHMAVSLQDGTRVIIENEDLPLTKFHLKMCEENYNKREDNATKKPVPQLKLKDFLSDDDDDDDDDGDNISKTALLNKPLPQSKLNDFLPDDDDDDDEEDLRAKLKDFLFDDGGDSTSKNDLLNKPYPQSKLNDFIPDDDDDDEEDLRAKLKDFLFDDREDSTSKNDLLNKPYPQSKLDDFLSDDDDYYDDGEDHYFIINEDDDDDEENCSVNREGNNSKYRDVLKFQRMLNTVQEEE